ncbi:cell surface protein [Lachnospiraceae bacterium KM106-2]|nr:cell surface protein [Lachnospiraceae bacterium KM106-2]
MKKKIYANLAMVIIMIAIVCGGSYYVFNLKTGHDNDQIATVERVKGNVDIERKGISYSLAEKTKLAKGDSITTREGSSFAIQIDEKNEMNLDEDSILEIKEKNQFSLKSGNLFVTIEQKEPVIIQVDSYHIKVSDATVGVSSYQGSKSFCVLSGEVTYLNGDKENKISDGMMVTISDDGKAIKETLKAESLNDFFLSQAGESASTAISKKEIQTVKEERKEQVDQVVKAEKEEATKAPISNTVEASTKPKASKEPTKKEDKETPTASPKATSAPTAKPTDKKYVKVAIVCDTILNNWDDLKKGKSKYVPSNGMILNAMKIELKDGDTAYDVLKRACSQKNIQLEASYTPGYGSYYVEGIHQLYEFDCGSGSGWTYKVNGYKPNYGSSSYQVKDGDVILWSYTCDYGNDI